MTTSKRTVRTTARRLAKPAISLMAMAMCLVVGEGIVRFLGSAPDIKEIQLAAEDCVYRRSTNPVLGFELKANYQHESPDFMDSYERTNAHGQRDRPRTIAKPTGIRRILLLGDSVVEGYGLPEDQTISRQLEQLVGDNIEVLNFGVSAYCTRAEIELLQTKGLRFNPDVVVLVFVENDFDNFNREAFPLGGTIPRPAVVSGLFRHSHLFRQACTQLNLFHYGLEVDPITWNKEAIGDNNVVEGVTRFAALSREHGFQPLILVWPRFLNDEIVDVGFIKDAADSLIIEHLATMHAIPAVRLSTFFRQHRTESSERVNPRLTYTCGDELHPSKFGARVAAMALKQALADLDSGALSLVAEQNPPISSRDEQVIEQAQSLGEDVPNDSRVHNRTGSELLRQGKTAEAVKEFKKAIAADRNSAGSHNNLGVAYERLRLDEQAIDEFKRAIILQPGFTHAHFNLARAWLREGQVTLALRGLKKTVESDPDHVGALMLLGRELGKQRRFSEAEVYLKHALAINPDNSEGHNNLGVVYAAVGNHRAAVSHFQEALRVDPRNRRAMTNLKAMQELVK